MVFGFFGSKKKKEGIADLLAEIVTYQQLLGQLSAQSLRKLIATMKHVKCWRQRNEW